MRALSYLVQDDFGHLGRAWRDTDEAGADRAALVQNLLDGQYEDPVRSVAFNTAEGWSRDVTLEIADEVRRRFVEYDEAPTSLLNSVASGRSLIAAGKASRPFGSFRLPIDEVVEAGPAMHQCATILAILFPRCCLRPTYLNCPVGQRTFFANEIDRSRNCGAARGGNVNRLLARISFPDHSQDRFQA